MTRTLAPFLGCLVLCLSFSTTQAQKPPAVEVAQNAKPFDFVHQAAPVLKKHCAACHGGKESKGGFSINTRELILDAEAVVPGKASESRLIELIRSTDPDEQMPPKGKPRLTADETAVLVRWIDAGMPWESGFSFAQRRYEPPLAPRRPELPPALDGRDNPVDRILDAYLAQRKLPRPKPLDDASFLRRVTLDLHGVLPTPEQTQAFLADQEADKRGRKIDELLADKHLYAQHWLSFWNDLLRNDYAGAGYIDGGRKQITGWLYTSLVDNKPFDQFTRELMAPAADAEGFIFGVKWRGNVNSSQTREVQFAQNVCQVFLGVNMKCASCHDSFIDRWKLDEAYGLAAVYATQPLEIHRCDKPTGRMAQAAWLFPELGAVSPDAPQPQRLKQLAALMTHPNNGRYTRTIVNRLWRSLMGRGVVHPVDAMHTEPWSADLLDYLAVHLVDEQYDLKRTLSLVCRSQAYQSQAVVAASDPQAEAYMYRGPIAKRMSAEQFVDAVWRLTNSAPQKPHAPIAWPPADSPSPSPTVRASLMKCDLLMRSLGRPNREQVVTMRPELFTTLEAIDLANGQALADLIQRGGRHWLSQKFDSPDALIDSLYLHALSRPPTPSERATSLSLVGSPATPTGVEDLLWVLLMLPEFQLIR